MFVNRAPPPPPATVNFVLQHGGKPCKVSIALFVDYSYYSSTIRGLFVLFVDYSRTIRTIRRLFADYSYYSSTIRTIRFTILVLSIAHKYRGIEKIFVCVSSTTVQTRVQCNENSTRSYENLSVSKLVKTAI